MNVSKQKDHDYSYLFSFLFAALSPSDTPHLYVILCLHMLSLFFISRIIVEGCLGCLHKPVALQYTQGETHKEKPHPGFGLSAL